MTETGERTIQVTRPVDGARVTIVAPEGAPLEFQFPLSDIVSQTLAGPNLVLEMSNGAQIILIGYGQILPRVGDEAQRFAELPHRGPYADEDGPRPDDGNREPLEHNPLAEGELQIADNNDPEAGGRLRSTRRFEEEEENEGEVQSRSQTQTAELDGQSTDETQQAQNQIDDPDPGSPDGGGFGIDSDYSSGSLPAALALFGGEVPGLPGGPELSDPFDVPGLGGNQFTNLIASGNLLEMASMSSDPTSEFQFGGSDGDEGEGGGDEGEGGGGVGGGEPGQVINGTDEADLLIGGDGDDFIQGLKGDDTLRGEGGNDYIMTGVGNDVVFGGEGDDTVVVDGFSGSPIPVQGIDYAFLDGGGGYDTLILGDPGQTALIDLVDLVGSPIVNFEHFDLRGQDGDTAPEPGGIRLYIQDVLDLTVGESSVVTTDEGEVLTNTVVISGDFMDQVIFEGQFVKPRGEPTKTLGGDEYDVYVAADPTINATLLIDQDIETVF